MEEVSALGTIWGNNTVDLMSPLAIWKNWLRSAQLCFLWELGHVVRAADSS